MWIYRSTYVRIYVCSCIDSSIWASISICSFFFSLFLSRCLPMPRETEQKEGRSSLSLHAKKKFSSSSFSLHACKHSKKATREKEEQARRKRERERRLLDSGELLQKKKTLLFLSLFKRPKKASFTYPCRLFLSSFRTVCRSKKKKKKKKRISA